MLGCHGGMRVGDDCLRFAVCKGIARSCCLHCYSAVPSGTATLVLCAHNPNILVPITGNRFTHSCS